MNLPTFLIAALLAVIVILDIRYLLKTGVSSCGGNCQSCGTSCKWVNDVQKARRRIARRNKLKRLLGMKP